MKSVRVVLLRPRNADNLGSIARAMKNFGLEDWVVVSPNPKLLEAPGMHRLAVQSGDLLETVRRVDTFAEAIADCAWVVGTTMRRIEGRTRLTPKEVAAHSLELGAARTALVFGDERSGLSNEDLLQCHALSFIPTSDEQPSLNLAQAVVVYAYEMQQVQRDRSPPPSPALADDGLLRHLRGTFEGVLLSSGFMRDDNRHALDDLLRVLQRAHPARKEAELWLAAVKTIEKRLK